MTSKPLEVLKKGRKILRTRRVAAEKEKLHAQLRERKPISSQDQKWLDNEAPFVDGERALDAPENVPDYERGFLDVQESAVRGLVESAGELSEVVVGKKRKRSETIAKESVGMYNFQSSAIAPVFTKKENATLAQRIEVLDWYYGNGKNQSKTAKYFESVYPNLKLKQPLVSAWLKDEEKWREQWAHTPDSGHTAKRVRQTQHPEVTEMMELWVLKAMANSVPLTGEVLRQKWTKFADLAGVPQDERLGLSEGWLTRFKARNGLGQLNRHGDAASTTERKRMQELIDKYGYGLRDIFNLDG